jgi:hypothetical protein
MQKFAKAGFRKQARTSTFRAAEESSAPIEEISRAKM